MRFRFGSIALSSVAAVAFAGPAEIPADAVRGAVESAFRSAAPAHARLEIVSVPVLRHDGADPVLDVALPDPVDAPGPQELVVSCRVGDRVVAAGRARVIVHVRRLVWIAERDLTENAPLDLSALRRESREFDRATPPLFRPEPGSGFRLIRDVPAGTILKVDDVLRTPEHEPGPEPARASAAPPAPRSAG